MAKVPSRALARKHQVKAEVFQGYTVRWTPDGRAVAIDCLAALGQKDPAATWRNLKEAYPEFLEESSIYSFGGRGRPPEVLTEKGVLKLAMVAGGPRAAAFREWAATILQQYRHGELATAASAAPVPVDLAVDLSDRRLRSNALLRVLRASRATIGEAAYQKGLLKVAEIACGRSFPELATALAQAPAPRKPPSPGALRQKRYRERKKAGLAGVHPVSLTEAEQVQLVDQFKAANGEQRFYDFWVAAERRRRMGLDPRSAENVRVRRGISANPSLQEFLRGLNEPEFSCLEAILLVADARFRTGNVPQA